jgi:hypothetical protein
VLLFSVEKYKLKFVDFFEKKNIGESKNDTKISHANEKEQKRERERDSSVLENNNNNNNT